MTNKEIDKEDAKFNSRTKLIFAILFTFIITLCGTVLLYDHYLTSHNLIIEQYTSSGDIEDDLNTLRSAIDKYYYKTDIDEETMREEALKGYIAGLGDEYTVLMTKEELEDLNKDLTDFVGIGVYLVEEKNTSRTIILGTIDEESPAAKAGLQAGDIITAIDSEDVSTKGSEYISSKMKGEVGSIVKVTVLRGEEELEFDIERAEINAHKTEYKMLEQNIGYISFDSFTDTCDEEVEEACIELKNQGAESLIIDLRNNLGGYVDSALNIADLFLDKDETILITKDKDGNKEEDKSKREKIVDLPLVILVNEYSASASEILTGCLKDYNVATVVGTTTYGKGVIQSLINDVLGEEFGGALKVTVAEYFTPNENQINKIGIEPDEKVELAEDAVITEESDTQLQKAIEICKNK